MATRLRGGKTPPRLLEDLKLYNPQRLPNTQFNVLTQLPAPFAGNTQRKAAKGTCTHTWALKPLQSTGLDGSGGPPGEARAAAALCAHCRMHLRIQITYPSSVVDPCPTSEAPLHHFTHVSNDFSGFTWRSEESEPEWWQAMENFRCTVSTCGAELSIYTRSPRLSDTWVTLLTDQDTILQRAKAAIATDPARFEGVAPPTAIQVLGNLRSYLVNAMNGNDRRIMANNKRWMVTLGDPCRDILIYLGFERDADEWVPPHPTRASKGEGSPPSPSSVAKLIAREELFARVDDTIRELTVLLSTQDAEERRMNRVDSTLAPAANDLRKLLSCLEYSTKPGGQQVNVNDDEEHPFFAGLGTVRDFHDTLMIYAYDQQQLVDPENSPYYLQCLQGIAKGRESEALQTKAAIEESSGRVSLDDIRSAYEAFNFDFPSPSLTEDTIIGTFQSRVADAPRQEGELRRCLKIIGRYTNNIRIEQYASDTITSHEQALEWLGATADMNDEFIATLYSVKVNENARNEPLARQALEVISKQRGSEVLRCYPNTGELKEIEMDPIQAYSRLGVTDHSSEDDLILSAFDVAVADAPSQRHELLRALKALGKERNSSVLLGIANGLEIPKRTDRKLGECPVGLDNIGNTCYLNSLLQYFFTIKPLRSLVLNSNEYVMQIEDGAVQRKKVGGRQVTRREIERAQKFIIELGGLFQDMISAPSFQIAPKLELARLTMLDSSKAEHLRRSSVLSGNRPTIINESGGEEIEGGSAIVSSPVAERHMSLSTNSHASGVADDISSEGTLVEPPTGDQAMDLDSAKPPVQIFEDKENVSPTRMPSERPQTPDRELKPLAETSPSRVNEMEMVNGLSNDGTGNITVEHPTPQHPLAAPNRPPPVPPREPDRKKTIREEEELYRQQDVTEVIGNVLHQLSCAIKAESTDNSGEQIDLIKELFYGRQKTTTTNSKGVARVREDLFSNLMINVHSGPQDLYAALDAAMDRRMVEAEGSEQAQFDSISKLPAILQFYPNRTAYDLNLHMPYKVNNKLEFPEVIFMDRYMDSTDPRIQRKRIKTWDLKDSLRRIENKRTELDSRENELTKHDTLQLTAKFIDQIAGDESLGQELLPPSDPSLAERVRQAAADIASDQLRLNEEEKLVRQQLQEVWNDTSLQTLAYRLHAVFIHRGLVNSGHYWIYIFDAPNNVWRKYNDGDVDEVRDPQTEIFGQEPGDRPATAMFLSYIRRDEGTELVETLHREVSTEAENRVAAAALPSKALTVVNEDVRMADTQPDSLIDASSN